MPPANVSYTLLGGRGGLKLVLIDPPKSPLCFCRGSKLLVSFLVRITVSYLITESSQETPLKWDQDRQNIHISSGPNDTSMLCVTDFRDKINRISRPSTSKMRTRSSKHSKQLDRRGFNSTICSNFSYLNWHLNKSKSFYDLENEDKATRIRWSLEFV